MILYPKCSEINETNYRYVDGASCDFYSQEGESEFKYNEFCCTDYMECCEDNKICNTYEDLSIVYARNICREQCSNHDCDNELSDIEQLLYIDQQPEIEQLSDIEQQSDIEPNIIINMEQLDVPDPGNNWIISECSLRQEIELEDEENISFGDKNCTNISQEECCWLNIICDNGDRINAVDICSRCRDVVCNIEDMGCLYPEQAKNNVAEFYSDNCDSYLPGNSNHKYCCDSEIESCRNDNTTYRALNICDGCSNVNCSGYVISNNNQQSLNSNKKKIKDFEETILGLPVTLFFTVAFVIFSLLLGIIYFIFI